MDLISRLKNTKTNAKGSTIPEIQFLENSDLCLTLNRGFSELYRAQPSNPVKFLSKWLLKESKAKELEIKYKEEEARKGKLRQRCLQQQKIKETKAKQEEQKQKDFSDKKNALIEKINTCTEFWESFNDFCEDLKKLVNATGVYLAIYDYKRKPVNEDDDETGHIDPSKQMVVRYIAWCQDHSFLKGKFLEVNTGVTYNLFAPKTEQSANPEGGQEQQEPPKENAQNDGQKPEDNANKEVKEEKKLPFLEIPDVISDPKVKYFKEPRLGSYLAIDINYNTSLNYESLKSSITKFKEYTDKKTEQEERYKKWKEENDAIIKEIEEEKAKRLKEEEEKKLMEEQNNENNNNPEEQQPEGAEKKPEGEQQPQPQQPPVEQPKPNPQPEKPNEPAPEEEDIIKTLEAKLVEWKEEPVTLEDFQTSQQKLILCLDTLGQDRTFSNEEKDYIDNVAKTILNALQLHEKQLLEKDRDLRIKFEEAETELKAMEDYTEEKYEANAKAAANEYLTSDEFKELEKDKEKIKDETDKALEGDKAKIRFYTDAILVKQPSDILLSFAEFEFVEYEKIFQNLFYFAHQDPLMINEPDTNKLDWKRAKSLWKGIFSYIKEYEPRGPKPDEVTKQIYKLNKIKENLEGCIQRRKEVEEYSFSLLLLVDYILAIIKLRYDDIVYRRTIKKAAMEERERIIAANNEIEEQRNKFIEELKAQKEAEDKAKAEAEGANPEEKKEEEKKEEKKEEAPQPSQENQANEATNANPNPEEQEQPVNPFEEALKKFDEEHQKAEEPPEVQYDLDNDYDNIPF